MFNQAPDSNSENNNANTSNLSEEKLETTIERVENILSPENIQLAKAIITKENELYQTFGGDERGNMDVISTAQFANNPEAKERHDSMVGSRNEMLAKLRATLPNLDENLENLDIEKGKFGISEDDYLTLKNLLK